MTSINVLLDKADHQYKLLQERKSALENLLVCISDHTADSSVPAGPTQSTGGGGSANTTSSSSSATSSTSAINKNIQMLAQKYCSDCRNAFEELSKIIQVSAVMLDKYLARRSEGQDILPADGVRVRLYRNWHPYFHFLTEMAKVTFSYWSFEQIYIHTGISNAVQIMLSASCCQIGSLYKILAGQCDFGHFCEKMGVSFTSIRVTDVHHNCSFKFRPPNCHEIPENLEIFHVLKCPEKNAFVLKILK